MKGNETIFVCSNCGEEYLKWQGKCENCGNWNTLKEFKPAKTKSKTSVGALEIYNLKDVVVKNFQRVSTEISEIDRVLVFTYNSRIFWKNAH